MMTKEQKDLIEEMLDALKLCHKVFKMEETDTYISLKVGMAISKGTRALK